MPDQSVEEFLGIGQPQQGAPTTTTTTAPPQQSVEEFLGIPAPPPSPGWSMDSVGKLFNDYVWGPTKYVAGKAAAAGLATFKPAAQAEMAQAGIPLDQSDFSPNKVVFGTDKPEAPGPVSKYMGALAEAYAGNPMFGMLAPWATAGGALLGQVGEDQFGPTGRLVGSIVGGGLGALRSLGELSVKGLATKVAGGQPGTIQDAATGLWNAAKDWLTTTAPGEGLNGAKTKIATDLHAALTAKPFLTQQEIDDAINAAKSQAKELQSDMLHVKNVADAKTPGDAYNTAMRNTDIDGTKLTVLRKQLPSATDQLAASHVMYSPKGWDGLAKESKEAMVPNKLTRYMLDKAVERETRSAVEKWVPAIGGEALGTSIGTYIGSLFGMPVEGGVAGTIGGAVTPAVVRGARTAVTNPLMMAYPAAGAGVGAIESGTEKK